MICVVASPKSRFTHPTSFNEIVISTALRYVTLVFSTTWVNRGHGTIEVCMALQCVGSTLQAKSTQCTENNRPEFTHYDKQIL